MNTNRSGLSSRIKELEGMCAGYKERGSAHLKQAHELKSALETEIQAKGIAEKRASEMLLQVAEYQKAFKNMR